MSKARPKPSRVCVWCSKSEAEIGKPLLSCPTCSDRLYCDRECKNQDSKKGVHKYYCEAYTAFRTQADELADVGPGFVDEWERWIDSSAFLLTALAVAQLGTTENADKMVLVVDVVRKVQKLGTHFEIERTSADPIEHAPTGNSSEEQDDGAKEESKAPSSVCKDLGLVSRLLVEKHKRDSAKSVTIFIVIRCAGSVQVFPIGVPRISFTDTNLDHAKELVRTINSQRPKVLRLPSAATGYVNPKKGVDLSAAAYATTRPGLDKSNTMNRIMSGALPHRQIHRSYTSVQPRKAL